MNRKPLKKETACLVTGIFALLFGTAFLLVLSKSSPLYPLNDWVDVNCFFTMGRSMLHGKVLYRDLYEQKGPVLYFVFALAALISEHSYIGVFLLEVLCFSLFVFFSGRIAALYTDNVFLQILVMLFSSFLIPMSRAFSHGTSVEELNLFLLVFALWQMLKVPKEGKPVSAFGTVVIGAGCAAAFWSKYTICGFYAGILLTVPVLYAVKKIPVKVFFRAVLLFLAGFFAVSLTVFVYFAAHHALPDLYEVYFYNNLTLYPKESEDLFLTVKGGVDGMFSLNLAYLSWGLAAALVWGILYLHRHPGNLLVLACSFAGLAFSTYLGGRPYSYYGLIFASYVPVGLSGIADLVGRFLKDEAQGAKESGSTEENRAGGESGAQGENRSVGENGAGEENRALEDIRDEDAGKRLEDPKRRTVLRLLSEAAAVCVLFVLLMLFAREKGSNVYLSKVAREDTPQYIFAEVIRETEDPTLLNYGFLDGGFYYTAGIIPDCRYFCTLNIAGTDMWDVQRAYINDGLADYVVTRTYELSAYRVKADAYEMVKTASLYFEGRDYTYYLYRRIR